MAVSPRIFISYRRDDSPAYAGRLFDELSARFGVSHVFMGVGVGTADVLIAVIGRSWASADESGHRQLDDPDDVVRLEIGEALRRNIRVIPVLVGGAKMPSAAELPEELVGLARHNALEIADFDWRSGMQRLFVTIELALDTAPTTSEPPLAQPASQPTRGMPAKGESEPRWILAWITEAGRPQHRLERAFRAGAVHEIAVAIGPEQAGTLAAIGAESFGEALGPVGELEQLLVMLIPPPEISPPQTGAIFLPRTGTSRPCMFGVQLPAGLDTFEAQIQVYHRNRVIQLALLRGPVVADPDDAGPDARIELELAVIRPGTADLVTREQFDLAVARTGVTTTGIADEELVLFDNDRIQGVVPTLTRILESIATGEPARRGDLEDPDVVENLRALAFQGRELDEAIGRPLRDQLGDRTLDRVQVLVESASDFFPIELVYGLPTPTTDAGLCPGWKAALQTGRCESNHEAKGPRRLADTVCPLGFWALSKVIERQVVGAESWARQGLRGVEFAIRSHPSAERMTLRPPTVALFAASNRVDDVKKGQIGSVLKTLERIADRTTYAETWDGWVEDVGRNSPTLLVLLSHTKELQRNAALEIGEDEACLLAQLNADYIRGSSGDRPVVLLLGCETAVADFGLQTFVSKFQDLGAALVVGTIASVLGQRAAPVARTIATELASASKRRRPIASGELLLAIRRKLLAKGELTALCLTAFGDADWQVGGG
jgi:hypothetical protein